MTDTPRAHTRTRAPKPWENMHPRTQGAVHFASAERETHGTTPRTGRCTVHPAGATASGESGGARPPLWPDYDPAGKTSRERERERDASAMPVHLVTAPAGIATILITYVSPKLTRKQLPQTFRPGFPLPWSLPTSTPTGRPKEANPKTRLLCVKHTRVPCSRPKVDATIDTLSRVVKSLSPTTVSNTELSSPCRPQRCPTSACGSWLYLCRASAMSARRETVTRRRAIRNTRRPRRTEPRRDDPARRRARRTDARRPWRRLRA
jgi:hypothetical protein